MNRKKLKCLSVVCTAVMAVSMTAGTATGVIPAPTSFNPAPIIASASESAEISAKAFGLVTPANSVKVKKGDVTILDLDWNDFVKGSNLSVQDGTTLELEYEDGTLVLNAITREIVSNSRKSGVSREKFYITNTSDSIDFSPMDFLTVWISKRDEDDNCFTKIGEFHSPEDYGTTMEKFRNGDKSYELEFDYVENAEVVVVHHPEGSNFTRIGNYNARMNEWNMASFQSNSMPISMRISNKWFPAESGYNTVEITNNRTDSFYASTSENKGTYVYNEDNKIIKVIFTEEEFSKGTGVIGTNSPTNPNESLFVKFNYDNGSSTYCCLGIDKNTETPMFCQMYKSNREYPIIKDDGDNPVTDSGTVVPEGNINGKPVVSDEVIKYEENDMTECSFEIYKGAGMIKELSYTDFAMGEYYINDYDENCNYYVRIVKPDGNSVYYKYNKKVNAWLFRINTAETPVYELPMNSLTFPKGEPYEETVTVAVDYGGRTSYIAKKEFDDKTATYSIATSRSSDYKFRFADCEYALVGIDTEITSGAGYGEAVDKDDSVGGTIFIPANKEEYPSDTLIVNGTTADGEEIHKEVGRATTDGYLVTLPDGEYDVSPDGKYTDKVFIKDGKTDKPDWDFSPRIAIKVIGKRPDGSVLGEYYGMNEFTRLNQLSSGSVNEGLPYYIIEEAKVEDNALNKTEPVYSTKYAVIKDKYFTLDFCDVLKGDVNLDGKVANVADLVMAQKYLLNGLDDKTTFGIENFIAFDVCQDGECDVFDLVELRKIATTYIQLK